ncbi:ATP-binding protein [Oligoflexia bacterium]|nr:ATP-binding protein [Oligoflexia bacterium]
MQITREFTNILESRLASKLNFMQVVLGPRQVGKTTGLIQIHKKWKGSKLMVTADLLSPPDVNWIVMQWQKARALNDPVLIIFDEIQKIPNWSEAIKILFDEDREQRDFRIVLLGSASMSLQRGLSESLAGRYELIKAHHWSYSECRKAFKWKLPNFLLYGGYPAAAELIGDIDRWQDFVKHSIISPVLTRDIQGSVSISKPALFKQTFETALNYPAQEISLTKLLGQLQDRGNVTTIRHYLDLFEGAYLLRTLQKYSGGALRRRSSSPKILPLCPGLVNAFFGKDNLENNPEWKGRIFEAAIGAHLNQSRGDLFYWRSGNYEVDYILKLNDIVYAIEVKSGRKRNFSGLASFVKQFPKSIPVMLDYPKGEQFLLEQDVDKALQDGGY